MKRNPVLLVVCAVALLPALAWGQPPQFIYDFDDASLVAYWPFTGDTTDQAPGGSVNDDGTLHGDAVVISGYLVLDGTDDYMEALDSADLDLNGPFTLAAWINPDVLTGRIVDKITPHLTDGYLLDYYLGLRVDVGGELLTGSSPSTGTWQHVAATWDGSNMTLYIDGAVAGGPSGPHTPATWQNALDLRIGDSNWGATVPADAWPFDGMIDEVRIYTKVLTAANIGILASYPPVIDSITPASQTVQYSDNIVSVAIDAHDDDSTGLTFAYDPLPNGLSLAEVCNPSGGGEACTWTVSGQADDVAGTYDINFSVTDENGTSAGGTFQIVITCEDATATLDTSNDVAILFGTAFDLHVSVVENTPDAAAGSGATAAGDIEKAEVTITLDPVGPGSPVTSSPCTTADTPGDYLPADFVCSFPATVPVNTYLVQATVGGATCSYYTDVLDPDPDEDVLVVYDPSLGFTTGGGWFYWGTSTEKTSFGFTMKYNKKATNIQGSFLIIHHTPEGNYRVKSNALFGLSLGETGTPTYGWASFAGKATYRDPTMGNSEGNYQFIVYVEDHGTPGAGNDKFWIEVQDKDGNVMGMLSTPGTGGAEADATTLNGGNIVVPHKTGGGGGRGKNK